MKDVLTFAYRDPSSFVVSQFHSSTVFHTGFPENWFSLPVRQGISYLLLWELHDDGPVNQLLVLSAIGPDHGHDDGHRSPHSWSLRAGHVDGMLPCRQIVRLQRCCVWSVVCYRKWMSFDGYYTDGTCLDGITYHLFSLIIGYFYRRMAVHWRDVT